MSLFNFGKKKEEKKVESCCGGSCEGGCGCGNESAGAGAETVEKAGFVKVLGSGCAKCNELEANVKKALEQLGMDTAIEHVTDFSEIAAYGVMTTPALVVGGKVISYGKVLKVEEAVKLLEKVVK